MLFPGILADGSLIATAASIRTSLGLDSNDEITFGKLTVGNGPEVTDRVKLQLYDDSNAAFGFTALLEKTVGDSDDLNFDGGILVKHNKLYGGTPGYAHTLQCYALGGTAGMIVGCNNFVGATVPYAPVAGDVPNGFIRFELGPLWPYSEKARLNNRGDLIIGWTLVRKHTASQSGTTITSSSGSFVAADVGRYFIWGDYENGGLQSVADRITAFTDSSHVTVETTRTISSQAGSVRSPKAMFDYLGNFSQGTDEIAAASHVVGGGMRVGLGAWPEAGFGSPATGRFCVSHSTTPWIIGWNGNPTVAAGNVADLYLAARATTGVNDASYIRLTGGKESNTSGDVASFARFYTLTNLGAEVPFLHATSNALVGIGTNTPDSFIGQSTRLAVFGAIHFGTTTSVGTLYCGGGKIIEGTASPNTLTINGGNWTNVAIPNGLVVIGGATPSAKLHVISTTEQLRLAYDATNRVPFTVSSGGDLNIAPTGGDVTITGSLTTSSFIDCTSIRCDGSTVFDTSGLRLDIGSSGGMTTITLGNGAVSTNPLVQWGGTNATFAGIRRSSTSLECCLADGSAFTTFAAANIVLRGLSSTSAIRDRAELETAAIDNTDATRKYRSVHKAYDTAAREYARGWGDGTNGRIAVAAPASAPTDAHLAASQISFYLDESGHNLLVRAKYADGTTMKLATIALA